MTQEAGEEFVANFIRLTWMSNFLRPDSVHYRVFHCYSPGEISVVVDLSTDLLTVYEMTRWLQILESSKYL